MGISPKNAKIFEKKIFDSIFEVNYLLNPSIPECMLRYNVEYSFPVFEITHKLIGVLNIRHNDLCSTVNLQYIYNACFPEQAKAFYDQQLRWYTLVNLEGLSFQLYTVAGINQKEQMESIKLNMAYFRRKYPHSLPVVVSK